MTRQPPISTLFPYTTLFRSGPYRNSLQDLVIKLGLETNVEFKGYVSSEEKLRIISESNALVFPSLCEGFGLDRKSTRLNSSHPSISYAVFCLKKKKQNNINN